MTTVVWSLFGEVVIPDDEIKIAAKRIEQMPPKQPYELNVKLKDETDEG